MLGAFGLGTALAVACLPDLGPLAALDAGAPDDAAVLPTSRSLCGDGLIASLDDGGDAGESCDPGEAGAPFSGCAACRVACDGVVDPESDHCYFDAGQVVSYPEAFRLCADLGAHVATFGSARELALAGGGRLWVGLAQQPTARRGQYLPARSDEPGWPCPGCFPSRDAGIFDPAPQSGDCVAAVDGTWVAAACDDGGAPLGALCEREPLGRRGSGCGGAICFTLPASAGVKTYVLFSTGDTAANAARSCALYPGGSLVRIDSADEREQLAREVEQFLSAESLATTLWIGLAWTGGAWRWDDGEPAEARPTIWGEAQPPPGPAVRAFLRMRDGQVDTQLAFAEQNSEARRPFVCQRAP